MSDQSSGTASSASNTPVSDSIVAGAGKTKAVAPNVVSAASAETKTAIAADTNHSTMPIGNTMSTNSESLKRKRPSLFSLVRSRSLTDINELDKDQDDTKPTSNENDEPAGDIIDTAFLSSEPKNKRRRKSNDAELKEREALAEFEKRDKALEAQTKPQYRHLRPLGFKFNDPPQDRPIRIYADGVFDLFHLGHMRQLEQAKKALPNVVLICGVPSDEETHRRKGLTVLEDQQRCETLKHCKWVDEVIPNAPWCVTKEFLDEHSIDYVAHDDLPYASGTDDDIYKPIKEAGRFLTTQRTEGISTSDIITKIIRDYDKYLTRNFARGASRKELNVSWLKKNELDLKRHVADFRESIKNNLSSNNLYGVAKNYISNNLTPTHGHSVPFSPATEFASNYSGGSFFGNVKGWMHRRRKLDRGLNLSDSEQESEESSDQEVPHLSISDTTTPTTPISTNTTSSNLNNGSSISSSGSINRGK
ncbi:hypothetical protein NADFUDRAFT_83877 [Nadsonia fulvescens var. elongata DSM 6958]|uniref:choline-phosphate cytidylyltransferase n=1 Tax=Nadsonia fulvescens var. elongata DSM 6958 TaxID=857566 RepID=A0A1E3PGE4_9ASCO|nr:hypothetical protein NADFUDRAFT_83877 [Nadsonia fulvescens var. elongata DSM 6958]